MVRLALVLICIWLEDVAKISKALGAPSNNMFSRRNYQLSIVHFSIGIISSPPPRQVLRDEILLKNKLAREMHIEQINEFGLRRPAPPGHTYASTSGYFHEKTKVTKENLRVDHYLPKVESSRTHFNVLGLGLGLEGQVLGLEVSSP